MRRRALIVGISKYDKLEQLNFCQNDADSMCEVLRWAGYDIPDHNKLTGYVKWETLRGTAYDFFVDHSISDDDILIFYYSGHGVQDMNRNMYLAPSEIDRDSPYKNGFSFNELTNMAQTSTAAKVVLIMDCCYSGSAKISMQFDGEGICLLAASQRYEEASVLAEKNHSVYTYYLIHGLRGKDPEVFDHSGNITVDTLSSYIYKKITNLPLEKRPKQRPLRKIESSGDIVIVDRDLFPKQEKLSKLYSEYVSKKDVPAIPSEEIVKKLSAGVTLTKVEKTFRTDFIAVLREVFAPHGLDLKDEIRITVCGEPVRSPDLLILERGKYREVGDVLHIHPGGLKAVIETKHPKKFAILGLKKLLDYCKLVSSDIGFTTNFKDLMEYRIDERGLPSATLQTLGPYADNVTFRKIAAFILNEIQNPVPKLKEITDEGFVKILQNCLADIQSYFVEDVSNLAGTLGIFQISYNGVLFKEEEQRKPDLQDLIRRAASFVILNQIVFYIALERSTSLVEQIENLSSLMELQDKFDFVCQTIDYKAVFGARVVSSLPAEALESINSLISNLVALNFHDIKREILGKIYHNLIPKPLRKRIAAYYTSNTACELLARLTIQDGNETVLDPSCGSGGFLVAAYKVKSEISSPPLKHKDLIRSLYGFDISIFASHLSVINLTMQDLRDATNAVYVTVEDAFNQYSSKVIELFESVPTDSRLATIEGTMSRTLRLHNYLKIRGLETWILI